MARVVRFRHEKNSTSKRASSTSGSASAKRTSTTPTTRATADDQRPSAATPTERELNQRYRRLKALNPVLATRVRIAVGDLLRRATRTHFAQLRDRHDDG